VNRDHIHPTVFIVLLFQSSKVELSDHCLIKRDKLLRCKLEKLVAEKQQRMSTLKELCRLEKQLCASLGLSTYADDLVLKSVPSYEELNKLSDHISALEAKKVIL
jgi:Microtubule associated protein (MAP65/ASE1 family)